MGREQDQYRRTHSEADLGLKPPTDDGSQWASGVWDRFNQLPIGKKQEKKRAINVLRKELGRAVPSPEGQRRHIVHDPILLEGALSSWLARAAGNGERSKLFMGTVREELRDYTRKQWHEISGRELGQLVSATAHTTLAEGLLTDVIRSYFDGPRTPEGSVEAMYRFADGTLDLMADRQALELAQAIGNFQAVIDENSPVFRNFYTFMDVGYGNLQMIEKATLADRTFHILGSVLKESGEIFVPDPTSIAEQYPALRKAVADKSLQTLSEDEFNKRRKFFLLSRTYDNGNMYFQTAVHPYPDQFEDEAQEWQYKIILGSHDPLSFKLESQVGSLHKARIMGRNLRQAMQEGAGAEVDEIVTTPFLSGEKVIDIIIPKGTSDVRDLVKKATEDYLERMGQVESEHDTSEAGSERDLLFMRFDHEGIKTFYIVRPANEPERQGAHALSKLLPFGLPVPEGKENVREEISNMQEDIKKYQRRFLNRRGIRVGFYDPKITGRGYSHVDLHRGDEPGSTRVKLYHDGSPYEVKLDKNLNFDLEGKALIAPQFEDSLHYYLLTILKEYFCKEALESSEGTIVDREGLVQARIPHLRLLPSGQRSGLDQRNAYLEEQSGDLIAKSEERKILLGTDRNTTYVRAVVKEEDETLEPITVHIDAV